MSGRTRGALTGLVAAVAGLGVAELVAGLRRGATSPVVAVGGVAIDLAPPALKTFAVRTFGTADKAVLVAGVLVVLGAAAAAIGIAARRSRTAGFVGVAAFGLTGTAAALSRPGAGALDALPALVGAIAAGTVLTALMRRPAPAAAPSRPIGLDRRRFLAEAAGVTALAAVAGGSGAALRRRFDVAAARARLVLPAPVSRAVPLPAGVDLPGVVAPGTLTPFLTPTADFYRVDTALLVPQVDPDRWRLRIAGDVDRPFTLSLEELLDRPLVERTITLVCVSNEVGGTYAGTATWLGVRLADLLRDAGIRPGATQLVSRSVDGFTAGTPIEAVLDGRDALVAVGMNGEPLAARHGFPARLVVPGLYGFVSATKWLTELEVTTFEAFDPYWVRRGWAREAPIKTMSRIDTPRGLGQLRAGRVPIAGIAWAPHRGITGVEVRVDDGDWQPARMAPVPSSDTWRQWVLDWDATPGRHTITCRATDATGSTQTDQRVAPIPDGATGWHQIVVLVS